MPNLWIYLIFLMVFVNYPSLINAYEIKFKMTEENSANFVLGNFERFVSTTLNSNPNHVTFHIKSEFFVIDSNTKDFIVKQSIDLDSLCFKYSECCNEESCILSYTVVVEKNKNYMTSLKVLVEIEDKDDNPPEFIKREESISLSEKMPVNQSITLEGAIDQDFSKIHRTKNYQLYDDSHTFQLVIQQKDPDVLKVLLIKSLDYETKTKYFSRLKVCDKNLEHCSEKSLIFNVIDENDNNAIFEKKLYSIELSENYPLMKTFLTVYARDLDGPEYNKTRYSIQGNLDIKMTFQINFSTGDLWLIKKLDVNRKSKYSFQVTAEDVQSITKNKDVATVDISVKDINNHAPVIDLLNSEMPDNYIIELKENAKPSSIFSIRVSDQDQGFNSDINCSLKVQSTSGIGMNIVDLGIYQIFTTKSYDFEQKQSISGTITCSDNGLELRLTSSKLFTVQIKDENEFDPVILTDKKLIQLMENIPEKIKVMEVKATDKDLSAVLRYHMDDSVKWYFTINEITGDLITTDRPLDREIRDKLEFVVTVTDSLVNPRTATALITIDIIDQNDNSPVFIGSKKFFVQENQYRYSKLNDKLQAFDSDKDEINRSIMFSLLKTFNSKNESIHEPMFDVSWQGEIDVLSLIDREKDSNYTLTVMVKDKGIPALSSIINITVEVIDVNDNSPIWLFPDAGLNSVNDLLPIHAHINISRNLHKHELITRLQAYDLDSGDNSKLSYVMTREIGLTNYFMDFVFVNRSSGELFVKDSPLPFGVHRMRFRVYDNGEPRLHTDTTLIVNVQSLTENGYAKLNMFIIIGMLTITAVISTFLIVAIVFIRKSPRLPKTLQNRSSNHHHNHQNNQYSLAANQHQLQLKESSNHSEQSNLCNFIGSESLKDYPINCLQIDDCSSKMLKESSMYSLNNLDNTSSNAAMCVSMNYIPSNQDPANIYQQFHYKPDLTTNDNIAPSSVEESFQTYISFGPGSQHQNLLGLAHNNAAATSSQGLHQIMGPSRMGLYSTLRDHAMQNSGDADSGDSGKGTSDLDVQAIQAAAAFSQGHTATLYGNIQIIPSTPKYPSTYNSRHRHTDLIIPHTLSAIHSVSDASASLPSTFGPIK